MSRLDEFRRLLKFSRHRLDDELERNAETMEHVGRELAAAHADEAALKEKRDRALARALADLRDADNKLTVAAAEAEAKRSKVYTDASQDYQDAKQLAEEWDHLFSSWRQRGQDLRTMANLFGAQYFAIRDATAGGREPAESAALQRRPLHRFSGGATLEGSTRRR